MGKLLIKFGKGLIIGSMIPLIFGITCLILANREPKTVEIRNIYGDTIKVTVEDGELVDAYYGTPLTYCDRCHGILNGRATYCFNHLNLCEDCNDYFMEKYRK